MKKVEGKERMKERVRRMSRGQRIGLCAIPVLCIGLLLLIFMPSTHQSQPDQSQPIIYTDSIDIGSIVSDISSPLSTIKTFTNEYSDESSLILSDLGVDMESIASYSANIDTRYESAHAIVILRPKAEEYTDCKKALADYIARKQRELTTLGSESYYQTALNALVYEHGDYLILVMEDAPQSIAESIIDKLDASLSDNG